MVMKPNKKLFASLCFFLPALAMAAGTQDWWKPYADVNAGDTAWIMTSSALVLFMTVPGLALFYGGMVRKKNILSTMMHSFAITALVSVLWAVAGYSLAFTPGNAFIGGLDRIFLNGMGVDAAKKMVTIAPNAASIPETVFMFFQMTFAIISTAIITGAFAERMKFSAMMLFSGLWVLLVYVPTAHWVWGGGFLAADGVFDYAGGTVVHINAGIAGLVSAIVIGKRVGFGKEAMPPHNMALTLVGAGMLWVGWFGFNAGSAVASNSAAGMAMAVTQIAAAVAALTWMLLETLAGHRPSALGLASGAVSGLVGITPAAGFVNPQGALMIGILTAIACYFSAVILKRKFGYDDTLDAFGIHGFGGIVGALLTGVLFSNQVFGGEATIGTQVMIQAKSILVTVVYSGILSFVILKVTGLVCGGLRVDKDVEREGLDLNIHGERVE